MVWFFILDVDANGAPLGESNSIVDLLSIVSHRVNKAKGALGLLGIKRSWFIDFGLSLNYL